MDNIAERFLSFVENECLKAGVAFVKGEGVKVLTPDFNVACSGFFDDRRRMLAVATGKPVSEWLPILIHELCHMRQWQESADVWLALEGGIHEDRMDSWVSGNDSFTDEQLDDSFQRLINVEADCERRVIKMVKQFSLPIDAHEYAQKACAYINYYFEVRRTRKWYETGLEPYNVKSVWSQMPTSIPKPFTEIKLR